ncbi:MAG: phosphoribosylglycinamide formyltransferase [Bacteroidota bacterium]
MTKIAIFASGRGSNARKIIEYFQDKADIEVALVVSNKANAPVLELASDYQISSLVLHKSSFYHSDDILQDLHAFGIDFIVLAGFLWLIPEYLVGAFPKRIINIHPALLPAYGGKGMYGMNVHRAVRKAQEQHSGITIHYVNEQYDEGNILFQARCEVTVQDSPEDIAKKVQALEHQYFPPIIEAVLPVE